MPRPQRVLLLHDYAGSRGGAEHVALDLRRLLRERGVDARLLASSADPWSAHDAPDMMCTGGNGALRGLRETWNAGAARAVGRAIATFRPDIVHIAMFLTQLSPSILPALRATPTVYAINTYRLVCPTGLRWTPGEGLCQRPAGEACAMAGCLSRLGAVPRQVQLALVKRFGDSIDRLVAPSSVMANIFAQHGWPCQHVIPHAVPAHRRRQARSDTPLVAFAGRLTQEKGAGWLLKAVAQADAALPGLRVEIIGDGPQRQALERLSGELGLADRVQFLGHLERMASQARLERAWVQVVPSLWPEPFGLVAAEALARGTAVIASDSGGPREIVDHGETGLVVATGDVAALAQALVTLTRDRALALAMGEAGQRVARERYGERAWVEAYLNVYGDMLDARAAARAPDPSLNAQPLAQA